ncbi:metal-dependent hydrolase [Simiduia aestuariiviva]|uniref:Hydrolase n=1 Tax=Simiduia aestuariiviva TaxID=1510459 RepID=A0A839UH68_9GAMM|nr:metal-dependent hydrolase [Simiduia aestuariiviva]MBB3167384.1 hypothetical protein [Simiduia aestuariiviva]
MPFTPIHMGPGILIKGLLQGGFSLMVFGWTQIVMDIQPLIVMLTGEGHLHGVTHTYIGATLLAVLSALTGKPLSQLGLLLLRITPAAQDIRWRVAYLSAFIGAYSHVFFDSIMHSDLQPFYPVSLKNSVLGMISIDLLHTLCLFGGVVGAVIYYTFPYLQKQLTRRNHNS